MVAVNLQRRKAMQAVARMLVEMKVSPAVVP
jgi:hypothetical protein